MKHIKFIIFISFALFMIGCESSVENKHDLFEVDKDGSTLELKTNIDDVYYMPSSQTFMISGFNSLSNSEKEMISFSIQYSSTEKPKLLSVNYFLVFEGDILLKRFEMKEQSKPLLTALNIDFSKKTIDGEIETELYNRDGEKLHIKNGKFDLTFKIKE